MIRLERACINAGVSYRQLDYWIRRGWIKATQEHSGSGYPREISDAEAEVLLHMGRLTSEGLDAPRAAELARQLRRDGTAKLGKHYELHVRAEELPDLPDGAP